ncbi:heme transporter CcmD [Brevibacillus choshinensis]|uniref:Heme transporter CcmD n=1 Tax=Brevibacillus choshinensis TaxID=54911 RepID=A0ABR5N515_BRECH|nr:protoglobin domain-containing protein [Brevibacillus choshinensis]KQL45724.1 heme transporter CcmD [Brevibacillus choshinensis]
MFGKRAVHVETAPIQNSNIHMTERLEGKLKFLQFNQEDLERIQKLDPLLQEHLEAITDRHYQMLNEFSNLMNIVEAHSTIERLSASFRRYLQSLSNTLLDDAYVAGREKIGEVHSRIGLAPEWYTGSYLRIYEFLIPAIVQAHSKRPQELSAVLLSLIKLLTLDSQIVVQSYQEDNEYIVIDQLGHVLELVMQIDKIKHVLDTVETTTSEAKTVRVASEQLSESVQKVAQSALHVAENANTTMEQAAAGKEIIQSSLSSFLSMADEFYEMKTKITHLMTSIENISQVVQVIRNVADQTNLLALNASIEAARAGEHGRGFAVVAEEVRKLAEQTKQSAQSITTTIKNVQSEAHQVSESAVQMSDHVGQKVSQTREAIDLLDDIVTNIEKVGHATGHIASIAQEQSAATSEISQRISHVQSNMEQIAENVEHAGQNVYDIGAAINEMHKISISQSEQLKAKHYLRIVKTDHLLWKWWLYNFMLGYHRIEEKDLVDHLQCRLGKWYQEAKNNPSLQSLPAFQQLDEPHRQFHEIVRRIFHLVQAGKQKEAEAAFTSLEEISQLVLQRLEELAATMR